MTLRAVFLAIAIASGILSSSFASAVEPSSAFPDKPQPVHGIHVDDLRQWNGASAKVLHQPDDKDRDERSRVGTVVIAPGISVNVDMVDNQVNFPYFFELGRAGAKAEVGELLLRLPVMLLGDTEWYFPGNGYVYVNAHGLRRGPDHDSQVRDRPRASRGPSRYVRRMTRSADGGQLEIETEAGEVFRVDCQRAGSHVSLSAWTRRRT